MPYLTLSFFIFRREGIVKKTVMIVKSDLLDNCLKINLSSLKIQMRRNLMLKRKKLLLSLALTLTLILLLIGCTMLPTPSPTTYTLTSSAGEGGTIDPEGEVTLNEGASQAYTITPDEGYEVSEVVVNGESAGILYEYTFNNIQQDHTITATFVEMEQAAPPTAPAPSVTRYTITASAGLGGTIDPEGAITVNKGNSQTFTITPDEGYLISDVLVDGGSLGAIDTYTFNNVQQNHTIEAIFAEVLSTQYILTLAVNPQDSGTAADEIDAGPYAEGTTVDIKAESAEGFIFNYWEATDGTFTDEFNAVTSFTMPAQNVTVTANFTEGGVRNSDTGKKYESIQDAIDDAQEDETIIIEEGTYYGGMEFSGKKITVQSADPEDDVVVEKTILHGGTNPKNLFSRNITVRSTDKAIVRFVDNDNSFLSGFTITGANNTSLAVGGAIEIRNSSPSIINNVIKDNRSYWGAAIYVAGSSITGSNPTIRGNSILENTAIGVAGGIYIAYSYGIATIENNHITGNIAEGLYGGGIVVEGRSSADIKSNLIDYNKALMSGAGKGGGIYVSLSGNEVVNIQGNRDIRHNEAIRGGGICIEHTLTEPTVNIIDNVIAYNNATLEGGGIAITTSEAIVFVIDNDFGYNQATDNVPYRSSGIYTAGLLRPIGNRPTGWGENEGQTVDIPPGDTPVAGNHFTTYYHYEPVDDGFHVYFANKW
jgi:hypothetical protein